MDPVAPVAEIMSREAATPKGDRLPICHKEQLRRLRPYFPAHFPLVAIDFSCCMVSAGACRVAFAF